MGPREVALIGLILFAAFAAGVKAPQLEAALQREAESALEGIGLSGSLVRVSGQEAVLEGDAASEEAAREARSVVEAVPGIASVEVRLRLPDWEGTEVTRPWLAVTVTSELIGVVGAMPDQELRSYAVEEIQARHPGVRIRDGIVPRSLEVPRSRVIALAQAAGTLRARIQRAHLRVTEEGLMIEGIAPDPATADAVVTEITGLLPRGSTLDSRLILPDRRPATGGGSL